MTVTDGVQIAAGVLIVLVIIYDVVQSVVMPRPAVGRVRLSFTLIRGGWRLWRKVAERPKKLQTRETALAAFAPMMLVALLILWGLSFILGYALIFSGLHAGLQPQPDSFGTTLYFSAGRMLAFPVAGIEATGVATRTLAAIEAASWFRSLRAGDQPAVLALQLLPATRDGGGCARRAGRCTALGCAAARDLRQGRHAGAAHRDLR